MQELPSDKPTLSDFKHDMNEHANARYARRIEGGHVYVLELERHRPGAFSSGRFVLTVWQAAEHPDEPGRWAPADALDNSYAWDPVGRETYDDAEDESGDAQRTYRQLKDGDTHVREWCDAHPYDGPRSTWTVRRGHNDD